VRVSALLLEVKRESSANPLIYNHFRIHFLASGAARDGRLLVTDGRFTITGWPGAVQPVSQHLPGWRFFVMARAGS